MPSCFSSVNPQTIPIVHSALKTEKLTNYNSEREIFMTCSQFYQNEMKFLFPWKLWLIFNSIWPILSTSLMVSFGIQPNCLVSLPKTKTPIVFSFPRDESILISCNWCLFAKTAVPVLQKCSQLCSWWTKILFIIGFVSQTLKSSQW